MLGNQQEDGFALEALATQTWDLSGSPPWKKRTCPCKVFSVSTYVLGRMRASMYRH